MHPVSLFLSGRRFVVDWTWHPRTCCETILRGRKRVVESRRALHASCPKSIRGYMKWYKQNPGC